MKETLDPTENVQHRLQGRVDVTRKSDAGANLLGPIGRQIWRTTREEWERRGIEIDGVVSISSDLCVTLAAHEQKTTRTIAVKVFLDPQAEIPLRTHDSVSASEFFESERRILGRLNDLPSLPAYYYGVGLDESLLGEPIQPFHVMELVEGESVSATFGENPGKKNQFQRQEIVGRIRELLRTLKAIHQTGFIHGELNEQDVLVDRDGLVRLRVDLAEIAELEKVLAGERPSLTVPPAVESGDAKNSLATEVGKTGSASTSGSGAAHPESVDSDDDFLIDDGSEAGLG